MSVEAGRIIEQHDMEMHYIEGLGQMIGDRKAELEMMLPADQRAALQQTRLQQQREATAEDSDGRPAVLAASTRRLRNRQPVSPEKERQRIIRRLFPESAKKGVVMKLSVSDHAELGCHRYEWGVSPHTPKEPSREFGIVRDDYNLGLALHDDLGEECADNPDSAKLATIHHA